ncbi:B12-binding domain-containing radical SAM protein [bacterium]|nr:B12-binding domain-containing radical SAM protein [bacterium]
MQITLISPPQNYSKTQETAGVVPPLGLAYLAAVLDPEKYQVKIIDAVGEKYWQTYSWQDHGLRGLTFEEILAVIPPDTKVVGISNLYTFAFFVASEIARQIRKRYPDIKIVLGGAHPTVMTRQTMSRPDIDFVILSEGEITFPELLTAIEKGSGWEEIDGLAYRKDGEIVINPKKKFIKDLDTIPFPRRDLLPMQNYFKAKEPHGSASRDKWTTMIATRGCPYGCSFCNTPQIWQRRWRPRSPKNVVDEIEMLNREYGVEEIHFEDESLTTDPKWVVEFSRELKGRGLNVVWQTSNGTRAESITEETLDIMIEGGCTQIVVAAESGSPRILRDVIDKRLDLNAVVRSVKLARKRRVFIACYFMLGLPDERVSDVMKSIWLAMKLAFLGADEVVFSVFSPLPGSRLLERLIKEGKVHVGDQFFSGLTPHGDMLVSKSYSDYIGDRQVVFLKFYGYGCFYLTKLIFHPFKIVRSIRNVAKGIQEIKTERALRTWIMRFLGKEHQGRTE